MKGEKRLETAPICIIAFNRPSYLAETLRSIKASMEACVMRGPVVLFQDGNIDCQSGTLKALDKDIDESAEVFRSYFPGGIVLRASGNLGIARNIYRAERWALEEMTYPVVMIFEDDMIISPGYFEIMKQLDAFAAVDPRIGMFAAYGYEGTLSPDEQWQGRHRIGRMHHNWAFGLTRDAWLRREILTSAYMQLLEGRDYRDRPAAKIALWYARMGWPPLPTNQDIVKAVALNTLGIARIASCVVCAKYIGAVGQHHTEEQYSRLGFSNASYFDDRYLVTDVAIMPPSDDDIRSILRSERQELLSVQLRPAALLQDAELVDLLPLLSSLGGQVERWAGADHVVEAFTGIYSDQWCCPEVNIAIPASARIATIRIDGKLAPHLPGGTRLTVRLNGLEVHEVCVVANDPFSFDVDVPPALDSLRVLLRISCNIKLDLFTANYSTDRRALSFLMKSMVVSDRSGLQTTIDLKGGIAA